VRDEEGEEKAGEMLESWIQHQLRCVLGAGGLWFSLRMWQPVIVSLFMMAWTEGAGFRLRQDS